MAPRMLPLHITRLMELFAPHCDDTSTNLQLQRMADDPESWKRGHALFREIRGKTLRAEKANDQRAAAQYLLEEACAKTLYNLSGHPAPFDADAPYWIVPNALAFARIVGVNADQVQALIAEPSPSWLAYGPRGWRRCGEECECGDQSAA